MCGICGLVDPGQSPSTIEKMTRRLVHRGPDDSGFHRHDSVSFGFRRLSIIDVTGGRQPLLNESKDLVLVANGEIYNDPELRPALIQRGHRFGTGSDIETLVHLYEERSVGFLEAINGMFALALHDTRKRKLILARDRLGIKPLYYAWDGSRLAFASEIKSLMMLPDWSSDLDLPALGIVCAIGFLAGDRTPFRRVRKLPPGHFIEFDLDDPKLVLSPYWECPTGGATGDEAQLAAEVGRQLDRAVSLELRSDVPIGMLLSGGIDSSAVIESASRGGCRDLTAFFVGWQGHPASKMDEWPFASRIVEQTGARCERLEVGAGDLATHVARCLWHLEEPLTDGAYLPTMLISGLAASKGVKVLLSGCGGDELFGGYPRYRPPGLRDLLSAIKRLGSLGWHRHSYYVTRFMAGPESLLASVFPWFTSEGLAELAHSIPVVAGEDPRAWQMRFDIRYYLPDDLLLLFDRMSMAASVEGRVPLLNSLLFEPSVRVAPGMNIRGQERKLVLRRALRERVPPAILDRPKDGFGIPLSEWLVTELGQVPRPLFENSHLAAVGLLRKEQALDLLAQFQAEPRTDRAWLLWTIVTLEIWYRLFVERREDLCAAPLLEIAHS